MTSPDDGVGDGKGAGPSSLPQATDATAISANKGQFAAFVGDSDEDETPQQTIVPQVAVPVSNKRTWAEVTADPEVAALITLLETKVDTVLPWGGTTGIKRGQKDGWYESDDEED